MLHSVSLVKTKIPKIRFIAESLAPFYESSLKDLIKLKCDHDNEGWKTTDNEP